MIEQNYDSAGAHVRIKTHAPSGTIILDRPAARNALSRQSMGELKRAFDDLHQERRVRAVILTGAGSAFCSGIDLAEIQATSESDGAMTQWHHDVVQYKELLETMLRFPRPIIAAVNGPAVGAGAGLVLASDIVVGTESARFGFPEVRRGLVAGVATPLLTFRMGAGRAANLLLTGRLMDAHQAEAWGIYHELVKLEHVWARAHQVATEVSSAAAESLQMTKRLVNETIGELLRTLMTAGAAVSATARTTEAASEGLAAFLEGREPDWP